MAYSTLRRLSMWLVMCFPDWYEESGYGATFLFYTGGFCLFHCNLSNKSSSHMCSSIGYISATILILSVGINILPANSNFSIVKDWDVCVPSTKNYQRFHGWVCTVKSFMVRWTKPSCINEFPWNICSKHSFIEPPLKSLRPRDLSSHGTKSSFSHKTYPDPPFTPSQHIYMGLPSATRKHHWVILAEYKNAQGASSSFDLDRCFCHIAYQYLVHITV